MTIDWSKAPEGATHYDCRPHATPAFMQKIPDDSQRWNYWNRDGELIYYGFMPEDQVAQMVQRPSAWTGEALPPVGTVCLFNSNAMHEPDWHHLLPLGEDLEVVIIAHALQPGSGLKVAVFTFNVEGGIQVEMGVREMFRPVRTAEQVAADEKRAEIEAIVAAFRYTAGQCTHCLPYSSAERLYEIGVRLQVAP